MFDNNAQGIKNALKSGILIFSLILLLLLLNWGRVSFLTGNQAPSSNITPTQVVGLDLTDSKTIQAIRDILTTGLAEGQLYVTSDGRLLTQSIGEGQTGPMGPEGPQGVPGANGTNGSANISDSGWTRTSGLVYLTNTTDKVSIGSSSASAFKLGLAGDLGPIGTNLYSLGSGDSQWKNVSTGSEGLHVFDTYTNASNYQGGTLGFDSYLVPLPGASEQKQFTLDAHATYEELKQSATTYSATSTNVLLNAPISSKVARGCRISLNGTYYVITTVHSSTNIEVQNAPAVNGTVNHVYCSQTGSSGVTLSSDTSVGSGSLDSFTPTAISTAPGGEDLTKSIVYGSAMQTYAAAGMEWDNTNGVYRATVYYSTDLVTWNTAYIDSNTSYDTNAKTIIYHEPTAKYIVAGYSSGLGTDDFVVWESTNLVSWTKHVVMTDGGYWNGPQVIVFDSVNNKFIFTALAYTTQNELNVWESTDLSTWTQHNVISTARQMNITSLLFVPTTGQYLVGGYLRDVANTKYEASIWSSTDLINWTQNIVESETGNQRVTSMTYDTVNNKYVAQGWDVSNNTVVWESSNLSAWTKHIVADNQSWSATVFFDSLTGTYIVGGQSYNPGNSYWEASIWYSTDLTNWTVTYPGPTTIYGRVHGIIKDELSGRFILTGYCEMIDGVTQSACAWYTEPGTIYNYPANSIYTSIIASPFEVSNWLEINDLSIGATLNSQAQYYSFSFDNGVTWKVLQPGETSWRTIVKNVSGTWQYNNNVNYSSETWVNAAGNTAEYALSSAYTISVNQLSEADSEGYIVSDWSKTGGFTTAATDIYIAVGQVTTAATSAPIFSSATFYYSDSTGGSALTLDSKASGTGTVRPIQFKVGEHDKSLFIDTDGAVGIGTNNPTGVFDVDGKVVVLGNGNVGIGTSAPIYKLDLVGGIHATDDSVFDADVTISGLLNPTSPLAIGSDLQVGGDAVVTGGLTVTGVLNSATPLTVGGDTTFQGTVDVVGLLNPSSPLVIGSNTTINEGLTVVGTLNQGTGLVIGGNTRVNANTSLYGSFNVSEYMYSLSQSSAMGASPVRVATGLINNDSYVDLVIADTGVNRVYFYAGNGAGNFTHYWDTNAPVSPTALQLGDFNNDDKLDVAIASESNAYVYVSINDGSGYLVTWTPTYAGFYQKSMAVDDINNDSNLDIIVPNAGASQAYVLYGDGTGAFPSTLNVPSGGYLRDVAVADLNGDSQKDMVALGDTSNAFYVHLNCGASCYSSTYVSTGGNTPKTIALTDVDEDTDIDILVSNYGSNLVTVHFNNGAGVFSTSSNISVSTPMYIKVLDFNEDGVSDFLVTNYALSKVSLYKGTGIGAFELFAQYNTSNGPQGIDVNAFLGGDSLPDFVVVNNTISPGYSVYLNELTPALYVSKTTAFVGIGTVTPGYELDVAGKINASNGLCMSGVCRTAWDIVPYTTGLGIAKFNTQVSFDSSGLIFTYGGNVLGANRYQGGEMLLTKGGTFATSVDYSVQSRPYSITSNDFNGDGAIDIATANDNAATFSILLNNGNGTFATAVNTSFATNPRAIASGDVNGDGYPDIVTSSYYSSTYYVYLNNGLGAFPTSVTYTGDQYARTFVIKDVTGDGYNDIIASNNTGFTYLRSNGDGTFTTKNTITGPYGTYSVAVGDVNRDGYNDVVVSSYQRMSVYINNTSGSFLARVDYTTGTVDSRDVALEDLNNDGRLDVITADYSNNVISYFINAGNGTFGSRNTVAAPGWVYGVASKDLTGDGYSDIVATSTSGQASVYINTGAGSFLAAVNYGVSAASERVSLADYNKDGKVDIATANSTGGTTVSVLLNQASTMFYAQASTGYVGIGTITPGVNLDVAGAFRVSGNITANNSQIATGTLANAPVSGTCVGQLNSLTQAVFQSTATITTSHIFFNATRARHSRISGVATCTDGGSVQYRILTLQDSITGNTAGDTYTVYNPQSDIGNASNGFFKNIYAVSINGLTSTLSGGFDVAEQYQTKDSTIEAGDVVSIDIGSGNTLIKESYVMKSFSESDNKVLGVISTNPGLTLGGEREGTWVKVALVGRVPVKVSTANGSIRAGDFLTSSTEPGIAVRAMHSGMTIGRALQDFVCPEGEAICSGTVEMFVNTMWYSSGLAVAPTVTPIATPTMLLTAPQSGYAVMKPGDTSVLVTYKTVFPEMPVLSVTSKKSTIAFEILNESATGFTIKIAEPLTEEMQFTWIAMPLSSSSTSYSSD